MNLRETQQKIENAIADSIESAEGLHRISANSLFDQMGQIEAISAIVQSARPLYENGAAQVFEAGRSLNRSAGELSRALIDRIGM